MSEHWSDSLRANEWASRYNMTLEDLGGQATGGCDDDHRRESSETACCLPEILVNTGDCVEDLPMEAADPLDGAVVLEVVVDASLDLVAELDNPSR